MRLLVAALLLGFSPTVLTAAEAEPAAAEAQAVPFYPEGVDGPKVLGAALASARAEGKLAVIVFGADWCHDSRGLARMLTSDAFKSEFGARFAVTFIDVAIPQDGRGVNLDLVKRFGVKNLKSTPAMFVISPKGKRINSKKDAVSWRNADSRSEAEVLGWFRTLAAKQG